MSLPSLHSDVTLIFRTSSVADVGGEQSQFKKWVQSGNCSDPQWKMWVYLFKRLKKQSRVKASRPFSPSWWKASQQEQCWFFPSGSSCLSTIPVACLPQTIILICPKIFVPRCSLWPYIFLHKRLRMSMILLKDLLLIPSSHKGDPWPIFFKLRAFLPSQCSGNSTAYSSKEEGACR